MTSAYDQQVLPRQSLRIMAALSAPSAYSPAVDRLAPPSIFHEPWWLDLATGGRWAMARVMHGNQVLGEMPYYLARRGVWRVSPLPPLTRTLGPVIRPMGLDAAHELRHRLRVTSQLIEQLPAVDCFFQVFDCHVQDAVAFALHGFTVSARYTFQVGAPSAATDVWDRMHSKTRNAIRNASRTLKVQPFDAPSQFLRFYESNLASRSRTNAYGRDAMSALLHATLERRAGRLIGAYDSGGLVGAIGLVWDRHTMYYLLSSRAERAHSGAISLLLWTAIQDAIERKLTFDFDGFAGVSGFNFLSGFGGTLRQRLGVERLSTGYALAQTLKRRIVDGPRPVFMPNL
ncbi:GNAT family N-acetyltransferase [Trinickia sp. EG282A]|uniref:GNAT family N-acetyltransferase n=1 Tax=Trinickia sp. EG282A TaxID=3237013 RepID=UPI0034D2E5C4